MDFKQNAKYFAKVNLIPLIVGIVLAVVGIVLAIISFETMIIGFVLIVAGIITAISTFAGRLKGADLDAQAQRISDSTLDTMYKKTDIDMKYVKMYPPIVSGGYVFDGDVSIKEDSDGTTRTSSYKIAGLLFTDAKVYIYENSFSFTDADAAKEVLNTYKYDALLNAEVEVKEREGTAGNGNKKITYYHLVINLANGEKIIVPVANDATTDETVKVLNRRFDSKKTEA